VATLRSLDDPSHEMYTSAPNTSVVATSTARTVRARMLVALVMEADLLPVLTGLRRLTELTAVLAP